MIFINIFSLLDQQYDLYLDVLDPDVVYQMDKECIGFPTDGMVINLLIVFSRYLWILIEAKLVCIPISISARLVKASSA